MKIAPILLLSPFLALGVLSATDEGPPAIECKTTKSDTQTWTFEAGSLPLETPDAYVVTVEHQTLISPCAPTPTTTATATGCAAGKKHAWAPYTATQILTRYVSYNAPASRKPTSTTVTNTWAYFPAVNLYAAHADLRPNCNCSSSARSKTEDRECEDRGLKTKCAVQCGGHAGQFTCLVESTDDREYLEGRICVGEAEAGEDENVVYLGEPCHVGDVMNECSICLDD